MKPGRAGRVSNQAAAGGLGAGQGGKMNQSEERERELAELRDRLSRLTEASLRINESLDFDTVLQDVLDSARSLTEARSGVITLLDDSGRIADFLSSEMTAEEAGLLWDMPDGMRLFEYLGSAREPLRLRDLLGHVRSLGLPEFRPPVAVGPVVPFMAAPVIHRGELAGHLYVAEKEGAGVPFACGVRRLKVPMTIGGDTPKANGTLPELIHSSNTFRLAADSTSTLVLPISEGAKRKSR